MLTVGFGLVSAFGYGTADFLAGMAARRASVIQITLLVYAVGVATMLAVLPWLHNGTPSLGALAWGTASGCGCGAGALFLAAGFRRAPFSIAGPLSAVIGAGLSVIAGVALGERPASIAWAGVLLALPAVMVVSVSAGPGEPTTNVRQPRHASARRRRHAGLAGVSFGIPAGIGCAISLTGLAQASPAAGVWPVLAVQVAALLTTGAVAVVTGDLRLAARGSRRPSAASGVIGAAAAIFYLLAAHAGMLAVAAVVTSLFPAVTVGLAAAVARERLGLVRLAGLALTVASVSLIALGGTR
jgi:drug/metabolite transporter (DMT)-like permease